MEISSCHVIPAGGVGGNVDNINFRKMSIRNFMGRKSSAAARLLGVGGVAMAFAALYIIMVQVNFDFG